jgi:flagella basal body P-ring formation protein FlgA
MKKFFTFALLVIVFFAFASLAKKVKEPVYFQIANAKDEIKNFIKSKTKKENFEIYTVSVSRAGSGKIFTIDQAINAKIADDFFISECDFSKDKFSAKLKEKKGTYTILANGAIKELKNFKKITQDLQDYIKVPILAENTPKGTKITQDLIEFVKIPEKQLRGTTVTNVIDIIGTESTRNLAKGNQISFTDVKKPIIVKKNDIIQSVYTSKNMEIKTLAIAQDNASEGDVIRLKNYDSGKIFEGKISKEGRAEINFSEEEIVIGSNL